MQGSRRVLCREEGVLCAGQRACLVQGSGRVLCKGAGVRGPKAPQDQAGAVWISSKSKVYICRLARRVP